MAILLFVIAYVLFQLYEYEREKTARYMTVEELKEELRSNHAGNEKLMP